MHGCVDGFSRKVLWLELATTNNYPKVFCYYYLQTVKKFNIVPTLIRSDKGTENTEIELVHQAFNGEYLGKEEKAFHRFLDQFLQRHDR